MATSLQDASRSATKLLRDLVTVASSTVNAQLDSFSARLSDALLTMSEQSVDQQKVKLSFQAGRLLKNNSDGFYQIASVRIEEMLQYAVDVAVQPSSADKEKTEGDLTLVPYEEMEERLLLSDVSRAIEFKNANCLATLEAQLARLIGGGKTITECNPFRPEVFLSALHDAWCQFDPDVESHHLILPLMRPDVFLDFPAILQSLNDALLARGILPEAPEPFRIKKSRMNEEAGKREDAEKSAVLRQLERLFSPDQGAAGQAITQNPLPASVSPDHVFQATAVSNQLLGYLATVQKNVFDRHAVTGSVANTIGGTTWTAQAAEAARVENTAQGTTVLADIKKQAPKGALTQVDENVLDLLTKVFDVVFRDQHIPAEIKALIGFLQVPVLKAALIDKDFFVKEDHPARNLIDLLSRAGVAWDRQKGQSDPLYKTIEQNVKRVQKEFDQQLTVFSDVVADVETFIKDEETVAINALSKPIAQALQQERLEQAAQAAKSAVALRIGTGEVVAFIEAFLESKWIPVLTLAYSIKDEKPHIVESVLQTMDDLIWSVKPKFTLNERKDLIAKLPSILARLNKWLSVLKLDDAEQMQFFADLAECHAALVSAPLGLTPQRRNEIAMDVTKRAAERRVQQRENMQAKVQAEQGADEFVEKVQELERGTWLELTQKDGSRRKIKLAWVSPLRSLYIFSTKDKQDSFSFSADDLALAFRENRANTLLLAGLVGRALVEALGSAGTDNTDSTDNTDNAFLPSSAPGIDADRSNTT